MTMKTMNTIIQTNVLIKKFNIMEKQELLKGLYSIFYKYYDCNTHTFEEEIAKALGDYIEYKILERNNKIVFYFYTFPDNLLLELLQMFEKETNFNYDELFNLCSEIIKFSDNNSIILDNFYSDIISTICQNLAKNIIKHLKIKGI